MPGGGETEAGEDAGAAMAPVFSATGETVAWVSLGVAIGCGASAGADVDATSSWWRDFWYSSHSFAKYILDCALLKRVGLEISNETGKDGIRRGMVNDLLWAGRTPPIRFADSLSTNSNFLRSRLQAKNQVLEATANCFATRLYGWSGEEGERLPGEARKQAISN